ncbi:MAG: prolyl oligopeptidase family serine peptidase, partial [Acidobacteriota bacterium]|nr:prolyl oligopeptidase family serine peptidase [Acidobacteriota bacterium]
PPLLILQAAKDSVIPLSDALQLKRLCILLRSACSMHVYQDQGHGFSGDALRDAEFRTLAFLNTHCH